MTGAGSSLAALIFKRWIQVYGPELPALSLSYACVGSGEGIQRFLAGMVDIGATDALLGTEQGAQLDGGFVQTRSPPA